MSPSTFGEFTFYKHQNVIAAKANGEFDIATLLNSTKDIADIVASMDGNFASLMDYRDWGLYTTESIEILVKLQKWLLKNGHKVEVGIIGSSTLKKQARETLLSNLDQKPDQIYVDTEEEGWDWLIQHGYCDQPG